MPKLLPESAILNLIEHVYEAGCDPTQWGKFVGAVHALLPDTAFSTLLSLNRTALGDNSATAGMPEESVTSYFTHFQFSNPYVGLFESFKVGEVQRLSRLMNPNDVKKLAFYQDWLKPAGDFTHAAGVTLLRDDRRMLRVSLDIPDRLGHLERPAATFLAKLGPHIKRAFEVNDKLQAVAATQHGLDALVERIDGAAFVITKDGCVLFANSEADTLARKGTLLQLKRDSRLRFTQVKADEAYRRALMSIADPLKTEAESTFGVSCPVLGDATVMVLPLRAKTSAAALSAGPMVLLHIRLNATPRLLPKHLLQSHFRLTGAEADVAALIAAGFDAQEIADRFAVSKVTVRNQLASILAKLGVRRQAEVATLLIGLAPSLALNKRM